MSYQVDVFTVEALQDVGPLHALTLTVHAAEADADCHGEWDLQGVDVTMPSGVLDETV